MPRVINGEMLLSRDTLRELAGAVLGKNLPFRIQAKGHSMSPIIKQGDIIVISPLYDNKPGCGDVLAFLDSTTNSLTVHRMVKKKGDQYFFRGDNSLGSIEMVTSQKILGRLTRIERKGKTIHLGLGPERILIGFLNRNKGFAFILQALRLAHRMLQRRTG